MKKLTTKTFITLAAVALAAPFFAMAVVVGVRAVESAAGAEENFLLLALALLAVASSVLKARGDKTSASALAGQKEFVAVRHQETRSHGASALHLGW